MTKLLTYDVSRWVYLNCIVVGACSCGIVHYVYNVWRLPINVSVKAPDEGGHNSCVDVGDVNCIS